MNIVWVGPGDTVSAELRSLLRTAGFVVSRPKRTSARQLGTRTIHAIVGDGVTLTELKALLGGSRSVLSLFTAQAAKSGRTRVGKGRSSGQLTMSLRGLRESVGRTQGEVARRVSMTQPQLSRVETRRDHLISTLHRYVGALGGNIEVAAVIDGARIILHNV